MTSAPPYTVPLTYEYVPQSDGYYMFATEYAPLGDLTSNITELGLGEQHTKRVACQVRQCQDADGGALPLAGRLGARVDTQQGTLSSRRQAGQHPCVQVIASQVISCQLSVVSCQLPVVSHQLSVVSCQLSVASW